MSGEEAAIDESLERKGSLGFSGGIGGSVAAILTLLLPDALLEVDTDKEGTPAPAMGIRAPAAPKHKLAHAMASRFLCSGFFFSLITNYREYWITFEKDPLKFFNLQ